MNFTLVYSHTHADCVLLTSSITVPCNFDTTIYIVVYRFKHVLFALQQQQQQQQQEQEQEQQQQPQPQPQPQPPPRRQRQQQQQQQQGTTLLVVLLPTHAPCLTFFVVQTKYLLAFPFSPACTRLQGYALPAIRGLALDSRLVVSGCMQFQPALVQRNRWIKPNNQKNPA